MYDTSLFILLPMNSSSKNNFIFWYTLTAIAIFITLYLIRGNTFEDDAYIFYRYAENWALGYGPVFNIGEYVEGNSNFLWTGVLAIGSWLSFDLVKFAPFLNLIIGVLCLFLMGRIINFIPFSKPRLMGIILPTFFALSYGFYYYAASGMDTTIETLVLLLCIVSLYKNKTRGRYLFTLPSLFLLNISRPEGILYSGMLLAVLTIFVFIENRNIPKQLLLTISIFIGSILLIFGARYVIYGELIPAVVMAKGLSFYLFKKAFFQGDYQAIKEFIKIILSGLTYESFLLYLGAWIPFVVFFGERNRNDVLPWLFAASIAVNVFVSVWAGGDYMPFKRHFVPVLPLLIIFFAWSADLLFHKYWKGGIFNKALLSMSGGVLLILWIWVWIQPSIFTKPYFTGKEKVVYLEEIGSLLRNIPVPTVLLSNMIGKISYHAGPKVYVRDILGLTNIHNAKYGEDWGFNWGRGSCGRTDFNYSFTTPFDIFFYNSRNMHNRFISFCKENPFLCKRYRFLKRDDWIQPGQYIIGIIANIDHPVSTALEKRFGTVALPIDESLRDIIRVN